jgi:hypothetical protein
MKICLLLNGLVRDNSSFSYLKDYILDKYDCDVACQYWDVEGSDKTLTESYNPKFKKSDKPHEPKDYPYHLSKYPDFIKNYRFFAQFLSLKNAADLICWEKYDFIVRARYDKIILCKFPDLYNLDKSKFYAPSHWVGTFDGYPEMFCDPIWIMPSTFKPFCMLFDSMAKEDFLPKNTIPEGVYSYSINYLNLKDYYIKLPKDQFCF